MQTRELQIGNHESLHFEFVHCASRTGGVNDSDRTRRKCKLFFVSIDISNREAIYDGVGVIHDISRLKIHIHIII
jgi:hypothetical protein